MLILQGILTGSFLYVQSNLAQLAFSIESSVSLYGNYVCFGFKNKFYNLTNSVKTNLSV